MHLVVLVSDLVAINRTAQAGYMKWILDCFGDAH